MSRSYKHVDYGGYACCRSEASDKKLWHQAFRRRNKSKLRNLTEDDEVEFAHIRQVSDPWTMGKDGKGLWWTANELRKEADEILKELATRKRWGLSSMRDKVMSHLKVKNREDLMNLSAKQREAFVQMYLKLRKRK
jgi:hypothetical protein